MSAAASQSLVIGRFPLTGESRPPLIGLSIWDHGEYDSHGQDHALLDRDFFRDELESRLACFAGCLAACEWQQEAHYQRRENGSWSQLDLQRVRGFSLFTLENRLWSIHCPVAEADITDYDNPKHMQWSLRETREAIDFAFRVFADAVVIHPGSFSPKTGRFWPNPEDALHITNNRRVAFYTNLRALVSHFVQRLAHHRQRISGFLQREPSLASDLSGKFHRLRESSLDEEGQLHCAADILSMIRRFKVSPALVRHCIDPNRGLRLVIENVEPPNFIINTPSQLLSVHQHMRDLYWDEVQALDSFPEEVARRYEPGIALDPNHLLNSQVVLRDRDDLAHLHDSMDELDRSFVNLPGEYPAGPNNNVIEPLLNKLVREAGDDIVFSYLGASHRTDRMMTTNDPIPSFREKLHMQPADGAPPLRTYEMTSFSPEDELNLNEVIQVLGVHRPYVLKVFDVSPELVLSSHANVRGFASFLLEEEESCRKAILAAVATRWDESLSTLEPEAYERRLGQARFYMRPYRHDTGLWHGGYDEAGFYDAGGAGAEPQIFATVKNETGQVWVADLD